MSPQLKKTKMNIEQYNVFALNKFARIIQTHWRKYKQN